MLRLSLRAKLLLAFALVLLPVLALLLAGFRENLVRRRDTVLEDQLQTAQEVAIQVDQAFDAAIRFGWAIANDPFVRGLDPERVQPQIERLLRSVPEYEGVAVFDAQGNKRGWVDHSGGTDTQQDVNISDRPYFRTVMATNAPVISDVLQSRKIGVVAIIATVPIRDRDGQPRGVVNVTMTASRLAKEYEAARLRPGQALLLVSPSGRLAFHTARPDLSFEETGPYLGFEPVQQALAGRPVKVADFNSPFLGEGRMGAFVPTPGDHWAVAATMPLDVALAGVREDFREQLALFALILLFSAGLAVVLERYSSAPLRRLELAVSALKKGELGHRVDIRSGDALEHLGNSFNDMSEQLRRRAEAIQRLGAEAQQRADELSAVIESIADAVVINDADGKLVEANPAAVRLVGAGSREEMPQELEAFHARFQPRTAEGRPLPFEELPNSRALRGETVAGQEMLLRRCDGEDVVVSASSAPVRDATGRIVLSVLVARNVTEQKRRAREEEALAEISRALVQELELEAVAGIVLDRTVGLLRADMVTLWMANPEERTLSLIASRNISPEGVKQFRQVSFDAPLASAIAARTGERQVIEDLQVSHHEAPDGWAVARRENIRSAVMFPLVSRGRLVGVLSYGTHSVRRFSPRELQFHATIADLFAVAIENAQLYARVREALRLREEFLAAAAHELKTPVSTIKLSTASLLRMVGQSPRERRWLDAINRQSARIAQLLEDLLIVIRLREHPPQLHLERFDLAAMLASVVSKEDRADAQHPVSLEVVDPLPIEADPGLIRELLAHLIENATRYSPADSPVEVRARRLDGAAEIAVQDHGVGISPEHQPHVFEPLYEPVHSGAPGYVGVVSLGLHLGKQIAEAHGGRISCESTPGMGSTFRVTFPLAELH